MGFLSKGFFYSQDKVDEYLAVARTQISSLIEQ